MKGKSLQVSFHPFFVCILGTINLMHYSLNKVYKRINLQKLWGNLMLCWS